MNVSHPSPLSEIDSRRLVLANTSFLYPASPLALDVNEAPHGIGEMRNDLVNGNNVSKFITNCFRRDVPVSQVGEIRRFELRGGLPE